MIKNYFHRTEEDGSAAGRNSLQKFGEFDFHNSIFEILMEISEVNTRITGIHIIFYQAHTSN